MSKFDRISVLISTTLCLSLLSGMVPVFADQDLTEIIVTARKRDESLQDVPVVETVLSKATLENFQVTEVNDLPKLVPGLMVGQALLSEGALLTMRGAGTTALDAGVDSSVAVVIDGLPFAQGLAFESGLFDLQRVEVLKGPQTLFYGKSSPAGVISLRTADPTDKTEVIATAAYDFESINPRAELIASGPVTDTLKLRLATMYSNARGFFDQSATPAAGTGALAPNHARDPNGNDWIIRGTALWEPSSQFTARLKINIVDDYASNAEASEITSCPDGTGAPSGIPFIAGAGCKLDRNLHIVNFDPAAFPGVLNGGEPYVSTNQRYGSLELDYKLRPDMSLTSTTGYYRMGSSSLFNTFVSSSAASVLAAENQFHRRDFTEEVRLNSDFASPVNFTFGGFYENANLGMRVGLVGDEAIGLPANLMDIQENVGIEAYSSFGQVRWMILPKVELAAGLRWSHETRSENADNYLTPIPSAITVAQPSIHSSVYTPDVTLTYKPVDDLTLYGAYKEGYLSGSYAISSPSVLPGNILDNAFGDEKVKGGEVGVKSRWLERQLTLNVAAFDYQYSGLQAGVNAPNVGTIATQVLNAGSARTYGIDLDVDYFPSAIAGLTGQASLQWDRARYENFHDVPCYGGQTIANGCNEVLNSATGLYTAQDMSGTQMIRAPAWQGSFRVNYELPISVDHTLAFSSNIMVSSRYPTFLATDRPNDDQFQGSYAKVDLGMRLDGPNHLWSVALIANNIANKITSSSCTNANLQNEIFGGQVTGGTGAGPAGIDEVACFADPGRSIWLRVGYRFGN